MSEYVSANFELDRSSTSVGSDAFEVWKTSVHQSYGNGGRGRRSWGELMDEYEDMVWLRRRRSRRLLAAAALTAPVALLVICRLLTIS